MIFRSVDVKLFGPINEISNFWPSGVSLFRNNHLLTGLTRESWDQSQITPCKLCSESGRIGRVVTQTPQPYYCCYYYTNTL
jgi:hypothetical protein